MQVSSAQVDNLNNNEESNIDIDTDIDHYSQIIQREFYESLSIKEQSIIEKAGENTKKKSVLLALGVSLSNEFGAEAIFLIKDKSGRPFWYVSAAVDYFKGKEGLVLANKRFSVGQHVFRKKWFSVGLRFDRYTFLASTGIGIENTLAKKLDKKGRMNLFINNSLVFFPYEKGGLGKFENITPYVFLTKFGVQWLLK